MIGIKFTYVNISEIYSIGIALSFWSNIVYFLILICLFVDERFMSTEG